MESTLSPASLPTVFLGSTGLRVTPMCLGTMGFCEGDSAPAHKTREADAVAILDAYVARGGNFVDTADVYGDGASERVIGRWLAARPPELRGKLVLVTKARGAVGAGAGPNDAGLSRAHLARALDASLARLRTSYVDIYMMHHTDPGTPLDETLHFLADAMSAGKIHYYAWANTTGAQTAAIVAAAARLRCAPPAAVSPQYSLLCRETEWEILPAAAAAGVAVLPWSPLKGGWLTGKAGCGGRRGRRRRRGAHFRRGPGVAK